jgi:hypothetical protein
MSAFTPEHPRADTLESHLKPFLAAVPLSVISGGLGVLIVSLF